MAKQKDTAFFENKLLDFVTAQDPMLEMMQWVMDKFMDLEAAHKTGAEKSLHAENRTGYRAATGADDLLQGLEQSIFLFRNCGRENTYSILCHRKGTQ